jgi:tetratricopeptide (TPR) repeat protein
VAIDLNNLARLYDNQGQYAVAEPLHRRALAILEKALGSEHPHVAMSLNNLAALLRATNRLAEAEPLYRRTLAINEKSFGPDHPQWPSSSTSWRCCSRTATGLRRPSRFTAERCERVIQSLLVWFRV